VSEDGGKEPSALEYNLQRLEDWVSPVTSFEYEVSRSAEECAERLLHKERTGLKTLFSGIAFEPEVVPDGQGGYQFFVSQYGVDNLRVKGLLINVSGELTSVQGEASLGMPHSFGDLAFLCLFFAIVGGILGALLHPLVGLVLAPVVWFLAIPMCGFMFRSYALNKQREFVSLITIALMLDAHSGSQKKKKGVM
jgi:hypothetical protein